MRIDRCIGKVQPLKGIVTSTYINEESKVIASFYLYLQVPICQGGLRCVGYILQYYFSKDEAFPKNLLSVITSVSIKKGK